MESRNLKDLSVIAYILAKLKVHTTQVAMMVSHVINDHPSNN